MRDFKFFQKEKKSIFSSLIDQLTPGNIRYNSLIYNTPTSIDGEVLMFVNEHVSNIYPAPHSFTTPIATYNLMNYEVRNGPYPITTLTVEVYPHDDPTSKLNYTVDNHGTNTPSVIREKSIEQRHRGRF